MAAARPEMIDLGRYSRIVSGIVFVIALLVYLRTLARGMHFGDGLELATAAYVMGVPHPTGYPLYMLLLKLASFFPAGELLTRTTLFSALCMAVAAALSSVLTLELLQRIFANWDRKAHVICAACAGLGTALLRFHWSNATVTEVYALEFLLMMLFTLFAVRFLLYSEQRYLVGCTVVLALGLTHHRLSLTMALPALLLWAHAAWHFEKAKILRSAAISIPAFLAILCLYFYLPLRARANPPINWGNPRTFSAFLDEVRGREYLNVYFLHANPAEHFTAESYARFVNLVAGSIANDYVAQYTPISPRVQPDAQFKREFHEPTPLAGFLFIVLAAGTLAGMYLWARRSMLTFGITALIALQNIAPFFLYNIQDISDYYLYLFWFGWLCLFIGCCAALDRISRGILSPERGRPEVAYVLLALPALFAIGNWRFCDQSGSESASVLSYFILPQSESVMPADSILITGGDQDIYTSWYRQIVMKERRDVLVYGGNFVHRDWYAAFFTSQQKEKYHLRFGGGIPYSPADFANRLSESVIEPNISKYPIFTSSTDPYALSALGKLYDLKITSKIAIPDAGENPSEEEITLYRILPKGQKEKKA
jgi:hypothetical protein